MPTSNLRLTLVLGTLACMVACGGDNEGQDLSDWSEIAQPIATRTAAWVALLAVAASRFRM